MSESQSEIILVSPLGRPGVRVAAVVHVFYPDLAWEIHDFLRNIIEPFDLILTTPHQVAIPALRDVFAPLASGLAIVLTENRGRDVGPFIAIHRRQMLDQYDAVLKLHSKKSTYTQGGNHWRRHQYRHLCGNSQITRRSIDLLRAGRAGMVGVHDCYFSHPTYWGSNRMRVQQLLQSVCRQSVDENNLSLGFFAGTMFWFSPDALQLLHEIPDHLLEFEVEAAQMDGTLAHALERVFCLLPRRLGYTVTSLELAGRDFSEISTRQHNNARWAS